MRKIMQKKISLKPVIFLFILILFSQNIFAIEKSEKKLLNTWNDFWSEYSEIDFNDANKSSADITPLLNNLIFQLEDFSKSDAYITETNGKKSESALYIDKALEHARIARTALTQNNQNNLSDFQKDISLLTIEMNKFMKSEIESDRNFMILCYRLAKKFRICSSNTLMFPCSACYYNMIYNRDPNDVPRLYHALCYIQIWLTWYKRA